jgi:hypothetical protein
LRFAQLDQRSRRVSPISKMLGDHPESQAPRLTGADAHRDFLIINPPGSPGSAPDLMEAEEYAPVVLKLERDPPISRTVGPWRQFNTFAHSRAPPGDHASSAIILVI